MGFVAHTPPKNFPETAPHLYSDHISEVVTYGLELFNAVLGFCHFHENYKHALKCTLRQSLLLHDLGKLDDENQAILQGRLTGRLPIDHIEAGVAFAETLKNELMAWIIRGHHAPGLPSKKTEKIFSKQLARQVGFKSSPTALRGLRHKRESQIKLEDFQEHLGAIQHTNEFLKIYQNRHREACGSFDTASLGLPDEAVVVRLMLSCLVTADHLSTACYSENRPMHKFHLPQTEWSHRLIRLNNYIEGISQGFEKSIRNQLRSEFYQRCFAGDIFEENIVSCSAPVGLGKTTSVMAYLLRKSIQMNSPRIFVIAPFSNIIDQTVKTLRMAIVLDGEEPEKVIVAHHHKANFSDKDMRQYTVNWEAPVVVTTAVQFFETLAAANPSGLKKLHAIIGSSIFIDESHACLSPELLKVAWHWLKQLGENYGCNIVLSSGSMVEFWNDDELVSLQDKKLIPDLISEKFNEKVQHQEGKRVVYRKAQEDAFSLHELVNRLLGEEDNLSGTEKPSCLVILNTVQSAAVVAYNLSQKLQDEQILENRRVLHLSTSLAPVDREVMLNEVLRRQGDCEWNNQAWYLIATSTVEAGIDLDFQVGYREKSSVTSFLQVSGRINRHDKRSNTSVLYTFTIQPDNGLILHPGFKESIQVFDELWNSLNDSLITLSTLCTTAVRKELSRFPDKEEKSDCLYENEVNLNFQEVESDFRVINSDTYTVITSKDLVDKIRLGVPVHWQEIQKNSVQIWGTKIRKLGLSAVGNSSDEVYSWVDAYEYDANFLGIMGGLLKADTFFKEQSGVF
ncbi:MAG: CRISPR-associated protein Cas3 [Piscirickettsiaceae bacterium CG_4_10_14_3_um_filter_44_349]|uniref:DEAD/DEAH box helicase n=1 Tax=Shewanella sp. CG18_big_fil_WC_8_21_14_2_50_42_11 TaxID=1975538 RepID=UPI000C5B3275|nr:DEAD/DEAH box helicase [Shewanella sp. CG18_big_fil_WC_8_21_14_2_50_42_11]NCQ47171.1 DEAD/DEAH box helicase [Shewanella frigidimarina]PIP98512.1 MAG: CRISPR-associated protein Cas3 [Shewanella sp. CG18_big_fil_WC_8_21_14_2_50_42_11]PIX79716.1 MAG: CRISPR-associated protein Cas3 [Piscirickettsiaceae bacterium CG_4_10_14_3_um_filter_44_349]